MGNIVAIIGRPNVGKSTLFNRLVGNKQAIVEKVPGVTRDRHYDVVEWCGQSFVLIDTGGYTQSRDQNEMAKQINEQIVLATEEASLLLFVVDCKEGITPVDKEIADILRKSDKFVLVVANKVDNPTLGVLSNDFYALGFEELYPLSAAHGTGTGNLLDGMLRYMKADKEEDIKTRIPRLAIIGRPNTGKSTLMNALLGQKRNIVHAAPHTTRTPTHSYYRLYHNELILVDTAGIAKKNKVSFDSLEFYSIIRSVKAIEESDVCLLLIHAEEGLTSQDKHILQLVHRKKRGVVLLINQWDKLEKDNYTADIYSAAVKRELGHMNYIPILFTSGLQRKNIYQAISIAMQVYDNKKKVLTTPRLNQIMQKAIMRQAPPMAQGRSIKINYITQLSASSPTFAIFCNLPQYIPTNYRRYLEKQMRIHSDFEGVPITLVFKKK